MVNKRKKGFTLVELLAVIVILAIILVIAVPKVMSIIEDAKMGTLESTAKMIASQAEKQKVQNTVLGNDETITCESITNINKEDYPTCNIEFEDNTAKVTIIGGGKFEGLNVCGGTKTSANATKEECEGTQTPTVLNCTFDGELVQGAEFIHNQYTYRYMQEASYFDYSIRWDDAEYDGWGVILTDPYSTDPVNTPICSFINGKPVVSTRYMFSRSAATSIDLSDLNARNVTDMHSMFSNSAATTINLTGLDTGNVTDMSQMFSYSAATSIDLSGLDTSNVTDMSGMFDDSAATTLDLSSFNTSNVTDMSHMFQYSDATSLDLSSFDTSKVTDMSNMFHSSKATSIDLSSFNTSNVTDMSSMFHSIFATTIYVSDKWDMSNISESGDYHMLVNATNLVGGNGTTYNSSYTYKTYARIDKEGEPGYFTYKASN